MGKSDFSDFINNPDNNTTSNDVFNKNVTQSPLDTKTNQVGTQTGVYAPVGDEKWEAHGFPSAFSGGGHAGWLYNCNGGNFESIKIGNGTINQLGDSTSDAKGLIIQQAIFNDTAWYTSGNYSIEGQNQNYSDVTPADVITYCIDNPTVILATTVDCSNVGAYNNIVDAPGTPNGATKSCGGIYFGVWDPVGNTTNNHTQAIQDNSDYGPITQGGDDLADNNEYIYSPSNPQSVTQNACNGPSGACDSTHYLFGCAETLEGAVNYSILQVDPTTVDTDLTTSPGYDPTIFSTWSWLTGGEGFSGGNVDGNNDIINQGTAQSTWLTNFNSGTTGTVDGCDDGTGIPNATNYDCCSYIGCNDDTTTGGNIIPVNYGVHNTGTNNVNASYVSQYTAGINIQQLNGGVNFGCESTTTASTPDSADKTCCGYVGCPDTNPVTGGTDTSLVYDNNNIMHVINNPYTWYFNNTVTPTTHPYAGSRIVGCDTAAMIADTTGLTMPTGVPDPNDFSCCWVDIYANQTTGCIDTLATNGLSTNDGCIDTSITDPANPQFGVANPAIFTCCEYNGCNDFTNQMGNWDYSGTLGYGYQYSNQVISTGVFDNADGTNQDPAGAVLAIDPTSGTDASSNPLKSTNGGIINNVSCTLPNFGCPHTLATNYDVSGANIDGCEGSTAGFFANTTTPTQSTICCEFIGCPADNADNYGPFSETSLLNNEQFGNDTAIISTIWENTMGTWGFLNGVPQAFGCDTTDPFNDLTTSNDATCCLIEACNDPASIDYICNESDWANWCSAAGDGINAYHSTLTAPISGKGIVTENVSLCRYGGCMDDSQVVSDVNDGNGNISPITHYAAANYDPTAQLDCSGDSGGTDYSCCKYYGCDDYSSTPTVSAPNAFNGINPTDTTTWGNLNGTGYDGTAGECQDTTGNPTPQTNEIDCNNAGHTWVDNANSIVGCVPFGYTINETQTDYNIAFLDSNSSWYVSGTTNDRCCSYDGCNVNEITLPSLGAGTSPTFNPHPYFNDDDKGLVGCINANGDIDITDISCCKIEGCNQPTAINYFGTEGDGCAVDDGQGNVILDENDIRCCHFLGCGDADSYLYGELQSAGAPADNTWGVLTGGDGTTQIYGYSGASLGCSSDDSPSFDTNSIVNSNDVSCCFYLGCNDPEAINAGTHANNNTDSSNNGLTEIKYDDPTTWTNTITDINNPRTFCSDDGTPNGLNTGAALLNTCCCAYKKGCNDPLATGTVPGQSTGLGSIDNGGCGSVASPTYDCTDYTTYVQGGVSDILSQANTNFPQWANLNSTTYDFAELDPTDLSCCNYQLGCPDSGEWNPYCEESSFGVWTTTTLAPTPGINCSAGFGAQDPAFGIGGGFFTTNNIGCDVNPQDSTPDSFVITGQSLPNNDPSDDLNPCCTYEPCPDNHCCISYSTPPIFPPIPDDKFVRPGTGIGSSNFAGEPVSPVKNNIKEQNNQIQQATSSPQQQLAQPQNNATYQNPLHPIPPHPNPLGGWGTVDLEIGHPCFCPNPYDPVNNPSGDLLVNCDTNQPINPEHPCPLPPPAGCPPKTGHPGHTVFILHIPGTWNPLTCKCDYERMQEVENPIRTNERSHCCGNKETGEIVQYSVAMGQSWPSGPQINANHCEDLGVEWISVPCDTDCDNPYEPTQQSWEPSPPEGFECCCSLAQFPNDINAGDILELQQFSNIPSNAVIPAGTWTEFFDDDCIGCNITVNHTYDQLDNYAVGAPLNPVPSIGSQLNAECCTPQMWTVFYGCVDPNADNYVLGNNAYGNANSWNTGIIPTAIGCPDSNGNPDPTNFTCCDYATAAGCTDPLANNYDPDHIGCLSGQLPTSTQTAGQGQPVTLDYADPNTYSCCDYSNIIGCADGTTTFPNPYGGNNEGYQNYDVDYMGCDDNNDGLPDGGQFSSGPVSDACCTPPSFVSPCSLWGGYGPAACDNMEDHFQSQHPNGTEADFFQWTVDIGGNAYDECCRGRRNNCYFQAQVLQQNGYHVRYPSTGGGWGNGTPAPGFGNEFPQVGHQVKAHSGYCGAPGTDYYSTVNSVPYKWYNGKGYGYKSWVSSANDGPSGYCEYSNNVNMTCVQAGGTQMKVSNPGDEDDKLNKFKLEPIGIFNPDEKTPEELEFERNLKDYKYKKSNLLAIGWIEGEIDENLYTDNELEKIETTYLYDANGEKINFFRETKDEPTTLPNNPEPVQTEPIDFTPPSLPTITPDQLSEIIKKAVKEVKLEIKRKNRK